MADKAKTLLQKLHLKPSTTLKVSKSAVFILLGLISIQTVAGGLLWYAKKIRASGGIVQTSTLVASIPGSNGAAFGNSVTVDASGNKYVMEWFSGIIHKYNSSGVQLVQWGGRSSNFLNEYVQGQFYTGEWSYAIAASPSGDIYATNVDHIERFTNTGTSVTSWILPDGYRTMGGITVDSLGNVYVAAGPNIQDQQFAPNQIMKFGPNGGATLARWGSTGSGDGQFFNSNLSLASLQLATDSSNNVYVVDSGNYRVQKFNSTGNYIAQWGSQGSNGNQFLGPFGIVVTADNNVYVQDVDQNIAGAQTLKKFTSSGQFLAQAALPSSQSSLLYALASDGGKYFVATILEPIDGNTSVAKLIRLQDTLSIEITANSLPNGAVGQAYSQQINVADAQGDVAYTTTSGSLPAGLSLNSSTGAITGTPTTAGTYSFTVQAADNEASDTQAFVIVVDAVGRQVTTLQVTATNEDSVTMKGTTNLPSDVLQAGFQYGLDTNYGSSLSYDPGNNFQNSFSYERQAGGYGSGNGQMNQPLDVATDALGKVYVVDTQNNRIQTFTLSGEYVGQWGSAGSGNGQFNTPTHVTVGQNGNIYVLDYGNQRVQVFDSSGAYIAQWGGYGSGNGQFINPQGGIDTDSQGNVYVGDTANNRVQKFDAAGLYLGQWAVTNPKGLAVNSVDSVYVSQGGYNTIRKFSSTGTPQGVIGGTGGGLYGAGSANGEFDGVYGIDIDLDTNRIFAADEGNSRVQVLDADGVYIAKFGAAGAGNGQFGNERLEVAVAPDGTVFVSDAANDRVQKFAGPIQVFTNGLTCNTTYHYRAFATDTNGTVYGNDAAFTTNACPDVPINITNLTLQDGMELVEYQDLINVENATGPVGYYVTSGDLPPGLSLNATTGYINGTPTTAGTYNFDVTVSDSNSQDIVNYNLTILNYTPPLEITTAALPDAQLVDYSLTYNEYVYTANNQGNVQFSVVSGSLPPGMALDSGSTSAHLLGFTGIPVAGTYTFTIQAQDERGNGIGGTDTQEYTIVVPSLPNINITTTTLDNGRVGIPYNKTITYEWYVDQPTFSVISGSLPDGISLTLNGYLQGTPTQVGTYTFTVQADDGFSSDTQELTLIVDPAPPAIVNTPFVTITSPSSGATFTGGTSVITGTGPANQTIALFVDSKQIGTTTANSQGIWSYTAQNIATGEHTLDAKWIPGSEIMFIPGLDPSGDFDVLKVIDSGSGAIVKTITLNNNGFIPISATLAKDGGSVLVSGLNQYSGKAGIKNVRLSDMSITTLESNQVGRVFEDVVLSPNGDIGYVVDASIFSLSAQLRKFDVSTMTLDASYVDLGDKFNASTLVGNGHFIVLSDDGTQLAVANTAGGASFTVVNTSDFSSQTTPPISPQVGGNGVVITGFDRKGNTAVLSLMDTLGPSNNYLTETSRVFVVNTDTQAVTSIPTAGSVWLSLHILGNGATYLQGFDSNNAIVGRLNSDNVLTSTSVPFGDVGAYGGSSLRYLIGSNASQDKLYTALSDSDGGGVYANVVEWNITGATPAFAKLIRLSGVASYAAGFDFLGSIVPPKDSITFTVPGLPNEDCTKTNTCACQQLGTCPKPCGSVGGTCPVSCTATNSCPVTTTTGGNTTIPNIIKTPFPSDAAPTTSRLGWFDRSVLSLARFIPEQAAIGFPYLLFILLLIFALSLYYQSSNEIRKDALNKQFLAKRKSIRAQQDNFIALASHYINTPITIIQGGVENEGRKSK